MRLALLSDLHGNPIALNAVLADIQANGGVDAEAVITAVERSHHPAGEYIISHFRGQRRPWWL